MHSVVIIRPATESRVLQSRTGYFGWIRDTHVDHVAVFFGCCVVTVVAVAAF